MEESVFHSVVNIDQPEDGTKRKPAGSCYEYKPFPI